MIVGCHLSVPTGFYLQFTAPRSSSATTPAFVMCVPDSSSHVSVLPLLCAFSRDRELPLWSGAPHEAPSRTHDAQLGGELWLIPPDGGVSAEAHQQPAYDSLPLRRLHQLPPGHHARQHAGKPKPESIYLSGVITKTKDCQLSCHVVKAKLPAFSGARQYRSLVRVQ